MASIQTRGKYTTEFKLQAVRQVKAGQAISVVSKVLNVPKASLGNWVRQDRRAEDWAAAGFKDTLLRWSMKLEVVYGNEKAIQPGVQG